MTSAQARRSTSGSMRSSDTYLLHRVGLDDRRPGRLGEVRKDPESESYYFVGKDNVPFHAVIWPAMLLGHGGLNLPTDLPANQYLTFKGEKASASRGVGRSIAWYADRVQPDSIRYANGVRPSRAERHRLQR